MSQDIIDTMVLIAQTFAVMVLAVLAFGVAVAGYQHIDALVALARAVPPKTAAFFGFMGFFLWTTFCVQGVINASTRAAKQTWGLMLYAAIWTLLVIHLQSQGFGL